MSLLEHFRGRALAVWTAVSVTDALPFVHSDVYIQVMLIRFEISCYSLKSYSFLLYVYMYVQCLDICKR